LIDFFGFPLFDGLDDEIAAWLESVSESIEAPEFATDPATTVFFLGEDHQVAGVVPDGDGLRKELAENLDQGIVKQARDESMALKIDHCSTQTIADLYVEAIEFFLELSVDIGILCEDFGLGQNLTLDVQVIPSVKNHN
jgi:hypothetical protein